jgi:arylsulfatase A-like enzyme
MVERPIVTSGNKLQPMKETDPFYAECAAHYFALIEMLDDQVGRVMDVLESTGLSENTVVLFLADHGEALGDHGMWSKGPYHFDSVIRVPFVVSSPARFAAGRSYDGVVSLVDIAPTILDLAGVPLPQGAHPPVPEAPDALSPWPGQSLLPLLTDEDTSTDGSCVVEMDEDYLGFKMRTLITQRYRLTAYSGKRYGELFDLKEDPDELHNLWDDKSRHRLRENLQGDLLHRIIETDISLPRQLCRS